MSQQALRSQDIATRRHALEEKKAEVEMEEKRQALEERKQLTGVLAALVKKLNLPVYFCNFLLPRACQGARAKYSAKRAIGELRELLASSSAGTRRAEGTQGSRV